ncbi:MULTISPECIES: DNA-binding domain-containing protein [Asticcacaulis]|uniref:HvfC/BufC N-terminal domain-containing protein n=1 Tax=Asticcacaulis TaxID=76890 RepID=UPI001AE3D248|nr:MULTISPECIES: DNA-binding domain-containing protein [Asticcacaulis]MBP2157682.1 hypothetical protein [Asticcacaulis solisilvae]MDR6798727.1 hypothetical protein [Asticcacaulis sp. BE141]
MPDLATFQRNFLTNVMRPPSTAPAGLRIHHDTWLFGLIEVLGERFRLSRLALGEEAFNAFARDYVQSHALTSGDRNAYGHAFPAFLRDHPQAASLPWLADLAAFESALEHAHHGRDAEPCALEALLAPDASCTLHPSVSILRLDHDIKPLHAALLAGGACETPAMVACDLLIGRTADDEVVSLCLAPLEAHFLKLINTHGSLFAALDALDPDAADLILLQTLLARLSQNSLLTST